MNLERMEWLASAIRAYKGQASVVHVNDFDDLPAKKLRESFVASRTRDYEKLFSEVTRLQRSKSHIPQGRLNRFRRQFEEIVSIDFFGSPSRTRVEVLLAKSADAESNPAGSKKRRAYEQKVWITRPRPGIDRVSSAWLIRNFIDPKARFVFGNEPSVHPDAIPFDMFVSEGFGHRGGDCTFETLCKEFGIRDTGVKHISQIVHDADLDDQKFGRLEGLALDKVLGGWAKQNVSDDELLARGMNLFEGLYESLRRP
jgi:hypothetical protein